MVVDWWAKLAFKNLGISQEGNSWQMTKISEFIRKLAIILMKKKEKAGCFALIINLMSCDCKCSLALHLGAVFWSAVCECGISCSYALLLFSNEGMELFTLLIMCLLFLYVLILFFCYNYMGLDTREYANNKGEV